MLVYVQLSGEKVVGYSQTKEENTIPFDAGLDFLNNPFDYIYKDGRFVKDDEGEQIQEIRNKNIECQNFLDDTDWKVTRHRDQLGQGIPTRLTPEEFEELLVQRQIARDSINRI